MSTSPQPPFNSLVGMSRYALEAEVVRLRKRLAATERVVDAAEAAVRNDTDYGPRAGDWEGLRLAVNELVEDSNG